MRKEQTETLPGRTEGRNVAAREPESISAEQMQVVAAVVRQMLEPVMENMAKALELIAASEQLISMRVSDLEKQMRLKTPFSRSQEKCLNDAIRARARALLESKGCADDRKAVTKLGGAIRKSVLARYGIGSLREAPAYDYETAMQQVNGWNDFPAVLEAVREARERAEESTRSESGIRTSAKDNDGDGTSTRDEGGAGTEKRRDGT